MLSRVVKIGFTDKVCCQTLSCGLNEIFLVFKCPPCLDESKHCFPTLQVHIAITKAFELSYHSVIGLRVTTVKQIVAHSIPPDLTPLFVAFLLFLAIH